MRIISGKKRGLKLASPPDEAVRPTTDRVKEALFGSLQFAVPGARVLDLFAGSGALGLEAWSRGAQEVVLADNDAASVEVIRKNYKLVGEPGEVRIIKNDYVEVIKLFQNSKKFDIVLIDPPYWGGFYADALGALLENNVLADGAVLVLESDSPLEIRVKGIDFFKQKKYGATILTYGRFVHE